MDLRALLSREFERRHRRNPRYSLRAFAQSLGTHHSGLLRLLRQGRRLTPRTAERLGQRLGLSRCEIDAALTRECGEAILALLAHPRFRPESRWLAIQSGFPVDRVNIALHTLLRTRRLTLAGARTWRQESA